MGFSPVVSFLKEAALLSLYAFLLVVSFGGGARCQWASAPAAPDKGLLVCVCVWGIGRPLDLRWGIVLIMFGARRLQTHLCERLMHFRRNASLCSWYAPHSFRAAQVCTNTAVSFVFLIIVKVFIIHQRFY